MTGSRPWSIRSLGRNCGKLEGLNGHRSSTRVIPTERAAVPSPMGVIRQPTNEFVRAIEDSRRWHGFVHRPDDIFISTPPKSGTTWMQGIVGSMLWPTTDPPAPRQELSRWVDVRFSPVDQLLAELEGQDHRRFVKTHSPADCTPIFEECRYVVVYRDGRDALMSWANHRRKMRNELIEFLNAQSAADGVRPVDPVWDGDMDELFDQWEHDCSPVRHLASWWPLRNEPFVHFVHYNDLTADIHGEMRRLADFLSIDIAEDDWAAVVERCGLSEMRESAKVTQRIDLAFEGGADSFFHKGTNGRWRGVLTEEQLERYDRLVAENLPHDAAEWLAKGSLDLGWRP